MGESFAYWGTTLELFRIIGVCTGKGYGLWQVPGDRQAGWGQVKAFACHVVMADFYCDGSYQTIGTDHAEGNCRYKPNLGHNMEEISR